MGTEVEKDGAGSCVCGRVQYRARGPFGSMTHCHCTDCRKSHGAAFATYVGVAAGQFTLTRGAEELSGWTTEAGTRRNFCRVCGSNISCTVAPEPEMVYIAVATFDTPLDRRPESHIFVRSRVPWFEIQDGLPQHQAYPEP
jgi:hypothetical protein